MLCFFDYADAKLCCTILEYKILGLQKNYNIQNYDEMGIF